MNAQIRIPSGLIGRGTETLTIGQEPFTIFGGEIHCFNTTPDCRIDIYTRHMKQHPKGEEAMEALTGSSDDKIKVRQWMMCRFGGVDSKPDIDENNRIHGAEYVPCAKRGSCPFEGVGCSTVEIEAGVFLSKAELAVARLIEHPVELIADSLFLSPDTIKTHIQNIRIKTNQPSKLSLALWARDQGII